jgi:hypothetical protein
MVGKEVLGCDLSLGRDPGRCHTVTANDTDKRAERLWSPDVRRRTLSGVPSEDLAMTVVIPSSVDLETPTDYRDEIRARVDRVRWLRIPARRYLAIDGTDAPGSPEFRNAIGTLYPVAYSMHFALKGRGVNEPIGALQGLYWLGGQEPIRAAEVLVAMNDRGAWRWRLLLPIPNAATSEDVEAAIRAVRSKKEPPRIDELWILDWEEGTVAQIVHLGPYADEPATIERLDRAVADAGLHSRGVHHEIYLSDPHLGRPERMRTLLRQDIAT